MGLLISYFIAAGAYMNPYHPGEPSQMWVIADGRVHNVQNPTQVLDIQAADPNPGANLGTWEAHGGPNQVFTCEYT